MSAFRSGDSLPSWCEVVYFEIIDLKPGEQHRFDWRGPKEKLLVGKGQCQIRYQGQLISAEEGANLDLTAEDTPFEIVRVDSETTVIRICGAWGEHLGGSGLFTVIKAEDPRPAGDPVAYAKETNFDSHYHDCDEYWIIYEGEGVAVSENHSYQVQVGDCVATGMGHHHDFPLVTRPVKAVYFETTLEGQKRLGHLWNDRDGVAVPQPERI